MSWNFEVVAAPFGSRIGGMAWDGEGMLFSIPDKNEVWKVTPTERTPSLVRRYTNHVSGLAVAADGRVFACQEGSRRIIQLHADGSATQLAYRLNGKVHNHPCSVAVDRLGRVWFCDCYSDLLTPGPKVWPLLDHASILRQERSPQLQSRAWSIKRMTYDTNRPRALLFSRNQQVLHVSECDTRYGGRQELRSYPVSADGTLGTPRVLHTFGSDHQGAHRGIEGMCLAGNDLIVACAGWHRSGPGPAVMIFDPSGLVAASHAVPVGTPVSCAFGDGDLANLYIGTEEGGLYCIRDSGLRGVDGGIVHDH